ncbi:MAG: ribonuclease Z [Breznakibacter sp.]
MTFSVTILGSNSALPTSERYPAAQILSVSERFFLIDCGEGTQMQMRKYKIGFSKIDHVFISHLHGDHVFGLIGLISTLGLLRRKHPLYVYAHHDLERLYRPHLNYFCPDLPFDVHFVPLNLKMRQVIFEDKRITIESIPLKHRVSACGFIFSEKSSLPNIRKERIEEYGLSIAEIVKIKDGGDLMLENGQIVPNHELVVQPPRPRSYAYCSDTKYFKALANDVKGVDLLYHEATFTSENAQLAKKTTHSTAAQAAQTAKDAGVGMLVIGHFSSRYHELDVYLREAMPIFPNTRLAIEGKTFDIPHRDQL